MKSFFIGNIEIKVPVIQGGMGVGISLSGLASAVANEGGVGVISCAGLGLLYPKEKGTYTEKCISGLKEEIRKSRMKTKGIIGVNVMVALSNYADINIFLNCYNHLRDYHHMTVFLREDVQRSLK